MFTQIVCRPRSVRNNKTALAINFHNHRVHPYRRSSKRLKLSRCTTSIGLLLRWNSSYSPLQCVRLLHCPWLHVGRYNEQNISWKFWDEPTVRTFIMAHTAKLVTLHSPTAVFVWKYFTLCKCDNLSIQHAHVRQYSADSKK